MMGLRFDILARSGQILPHPNAMGRSLQVQDRGLGGSRMARYRPDLEQALQIPVIDPCQAAVAMALGRIALSQTHNPGA